MKVTAGAVPVHYAEYGFRHLYPDLPGMGRTPAPGTVKSNNDVLDALLGLIDSTIGDEPFLVLGHSYGAYLARAIANRRRRRAIGLALICPVGPHTRAVPKHQVLVSQSYPHPVLILAGRQDATAGYAGPWELLDHYPRPTFAVLDRAGHALLHEQPTLVHALVLEWLARVRGRST